MPAVNSCIVSEEFRSAGLEPPRGVASSSMAFNIFMLAAGRFLSLLPESMVRFSGQHLPLKVLPVDLPLRLRPLLIVTLKNRTLSPAAMLFIENIRAAVRPLVNGKNRKSGVIGVL
jgi:DNA-binding transcriptional LysR family regulator